MVVTSSKSVSPQLAKRLNAYSQKSGISVSRPLIDSSIDFLVNHTELSDEEVEDAIMHTLMAVHKSGNANYEGEAEANPTEFGK